MLPVLIHFLEQLKERKEGGKWPYKWINRLQQINVVIKYGVSHLCREIWTLVLVPLVCALAEIKLLCKKTSSVILCRWRWGLFDLVTVNSLSVSQQRHVTSFCVEGLFHLDYSHTFCIKGQYLMCIFFLFFTFIKAKFF